MSVNTQKAIKSKKDEILQLLRVNDYYSDELAAYIRCSLQLTKDLLRELEKNGQIKKYGELRNPTWRLR